MKPPSTKEIKKSASLPLIKKKYKILSDESKKEKELLLFSVDSLSRQVNKVREIKIYLSLYHFGSVLISAYQLNGKKTHHQLHWPPPKQRSRKADFIIYPSNKKYFFLSHVGYTEIQPFPSTSHS